MAAHKGLNKVENKNSYRRDLELILIGAALTKGDRERVLSVFADFSFSKENDTMLRAIRAGDASVVAAWLNGLGATLSKGKDAIQAIIDAVDEQNKMERVRSICKSLRPAHNLKEVADLKQRLTDALSALEGIE